MDLLTLINQLQEALYAEEQIRLAYLFGSALLASAPRDVDVGVWAPQLDVLPSRLRMDRRLHWGALLERGLRPRRFVDLHVLNGAPLPFQYTVARTGRLILVRSEIERIRYEAALTSAYLDFSESLRPFEAAVLARIG